MSPLRRVVATVVAAAFALTPSMVGSAHAAPPENLPHQDAFYQYGPDGSPAVPPPDSKAGDVLGSRSVPLTLIDLSNALSAQAGRPFDTISATATQLLYRTQDELGRPSATVTTVIEPTVINPAVTSKGVVAYLSYYDGLSDSCDPSYTLQDPTSINAEKAVIGSLLEQGYTVTVPDFEGEGLDWAAGHEAGRDTLDAVRATESYPGFTGLSAGSKVGLIGYSGGSIAGEWASELAPTYAPELNLVGTAIGGIPVNLADVMKYVDSSADTDRDSWAGVIPAAMVSLGRAYDKTAAFASYESTQPTYPAGAPTKSGQQIATEVSGECIGNFAASYPGLHVADLLQPQYADFLNLPDVKPIVDGLVMGNGATPKAPMLMVNGNNDGVGDGVMVAADVKALATKYCKAGLPVQYNEVPGAHSAVGTTFMLAGIAYLGSRFAATAPPQSSCAALLATTDTTPAAHAVHAKIKGHSKGHKDVVVVTAKGAVGAKVKVFRMKHGHKVKVGHGVIGRHGKVRIKVVDRNGHGITRYRAKVAATATTLAAHTRTLRLR